MVLESVTYIDAVKKTGAVVMHTCNQSQTLKPHESHCSAMVHLLIWIMNAMKENGLFQSMTRPQ